MIYVTGDIHANPERLGMDALAQRGIHMNPEDYVIVCGDFGIPWVGELNETDHKWLEWLAQLPYTVLFVDGNVVKVQIRTPSNLPQCYNILRQIFRYLRLFHS